MRKTKDALYAGIALVAFAYLLMAFVKQFIPLLIIMGVLACVYIVVTGRRW